MDASEKSGKGQPAAARGSEAPSAAPAASPAGSSRAPAYGWTQDDPESTSFLFATILALCRAAGGTRVLDLGCGNGSVAGRLQAAGFDVTGVDADADGLAIARARFPAVRFLAADLARPAREQGLSEFDIVVATEVVEHLYHPRQLPRFALEALRPNGHLVISTPYHGYLKNLVLSLLDKWDKHHTVFWDGGHIKFWSRATLTRLVEEVGFRVRSFHGVGRMPFLWKSMILLAQKPA